MAKRKVIDDVVKRNATPVQIFNNKDFIESKLSETARVSDKREIVKLNSRKIPNHISLITNIITVFNTVAQQDTEGIISITGRGDIVAPVNNIRLLKALAYCNLSPNEEFSGAVSEMFMYVLKQTLNRQKANDDGVIVESGTSLQRLVKQEIMDFYIERCS